MPALPTKKVAILQSNYIPWKGYFDIIGSVDEFIFYDEVQYTRRDWRNRNYIKTAQGLAWLTIPVVQQERETQRIDETIVSDRKWAMKHWRTLAQTYARAANFHVHKEQFEELYAGLTTVYLSEINAAFVRMICQVLGIQTKLSWSTDYSLPTGLDKTERLVRLVQAASGTEYLTGPAARNYLDEAQFAEANITLSWMNYEGYPVYRQLHSPPFAHGVSIVDLLFNEGEEASTFLKNRPNLHNHA
ncbi:WbqC family protein [Hymenobacter sp. GOD-10R]|uniref:WbqC family protein n=1 Tax=Hymenobacter sp. GOD-10R TaxID=3093922 RepID=UPI002D78E655|nr:WbqC family protein [Hymenobacter sp. GOD-10R]WRQ29581.1 WbqC family protein [Hymenobacter sp. GOD-10R]